MITIYGCFEGLGFEFTEFLLNEDEEVFGYDRLDEKKQFKFELIGRNAKFNFVDEEEQLPNNDFAYVFNKDLPLSNKGTHKFVVICDAVKGEKTRDETLIDIKNIKLGDETDTSDRKNDIITKQHFFKWLVELRKYSLLPQELVLNGEGEDGVFLLKC
ncbi:hypothetical protein CEY16_00840 [Halalkalibacillus sediminis]|uniref:Uncharacterized protein n=1 Tax=Halalkalibacillus sediminis TaxID=2018042 RepID=A0A2I0QVH6_9BACI|nr:hypothetical protein [Halalkalibacillus sediminis]PKR78336.1 hypothetical protein CEY16_00840 [Halalkalibacillus sediminis]